MQKADILRFLLLSLALVMVHCCFLWRQWNAERLRTRLLVLEWELASLVRNHPGGQDAPGLPRLERLIGRLGEAAWDIVYSRILISRLLLPAGGSQSCRQSLESIESGPLRGKAVEILDQVDRAVAVKLVTGSPLLWLWGAAKLLRGGSAGDGAGKWVPGYELLELSLAGEEE